MNLIQSICCFFSGRCGSGAAEEGGYAETAMRAPLPHHLVPRLLKPKISLRGRP